MTKNELKKLTEDIYLRIVEHYGESKHQQCIPYVGIEDSPFSDAKVPKDLFGEYCSIINEIVIYWKNIDSVEILARTLLHEYKHYLQSRSWMTRYYNMGYTYNDHPYEVAAFNEEENWYKFIK